PSVAVAKAEGAAGWRGVLAPVGGAALLRHALSGPAVQGVVASAPRQRIVAATAGERVVAGVACDDVGELVSGAVDVAWTRQSQVLDVGGGGVRDGAEGGIRALAGVFHY